MEQQQSQTTFNQIKGIINQLNDGDQFCSTTLTVGHEKPRDVNFIFKKAEYDKFIQSNKLGDKVTINFYVNSKFKNGRWYTGANVVSWTK